jgi:hypothetical protein
MFSRTLSNILSCTLSCDIPYLSVPCPLSLPTSSLPTFPAKSLGQLHSSSACLILGSDPDAVGVHVALKETPRPP